MVVVVAAAAVAGIWAYQAAQDVDCPVDHECDESRRQRHHFSRHSIYCRDKTRMNG